MNTQDRRRESKKCRKR